MIDRGQPRFQTDLALIAFVALVFVGAEQLFFLI